MSPLWHCGQSAFITPPNSGANNSSVWQVKQTIQAQGFQRLPTHDSHYGRAQIGGHGFPNPNWRAEFQASVGTVMRVLHLPHSHSLVSGRSYTNSIGPPHIGQKGTTSHGEGALASMGRDDTRSGRYCEESSSFATSPTITAVLRDEPDWTTLPAGLPGAVRQDAPVPAEGSVEAHS